MPERRVRFIFISVLKWNHFLIFNSYKVDINPGSSGLSWVVWVLVHILKYTQVDKSMKALVPPGVSSKGNSAKRDSPCGCPLDPSKYFRILGSKMNGIKKLLRTVECLADCKRNFSLGQGQWLKIELIKNELEGINWLQCLDFL